MMRASRLLALLLHVQRHGGATAPELASALEVSVRTIYRDVAALAEAGVPVWTEPGPHGGIRLVEGWRTRLDGLTGDEAGALALAGAPGAAAELGLGTLLATAQTKLHATLPPELQARAARVGERFHLDAPGWFSRDEPPPALTEVARALWDDRRLRVRYRRADATVVRTVEPLGLVCKAGTWYLLAAHRGTRRTYRVDRITDAVPLAERFVRPALDLAAAWAEAQEGFDRSILRATVTIRLSPDGARRLRHHVDPRAATEALATATTGADGWCTVELAVEGEDVARRQLFALGPHVEVLAPTSLRAAIAADARALAARNRPATAIAPTPRAH